MTLISVVVAANDKNVLEQNLLASPDLSAVHSVHVEWGAKSSSVAYNCGINTTCGELLVFVHQDVYLPAGFFERVERAVRQLGKTDANWGVLSCYGRRVDGNPAGRMWSSGIGRVLGHAGPEPVEATVVDELLLIYRRSSGLRFDDNLPGFHCYAIDLVATAAKRQMRTYVADLPVVHNSQPVRCLDSSYVAAYRYMQRKWQSELPLDTLVVPITRTGWALRQKRLRMFLRRCATRTPYGYRRPDPSKIAQECGFSNEMVVNGEGTL